MEGEGFVDGITGLKRRFNIDFDKLLPLEGADGPPPEILVVKSSSTSEGYDDRNGVDEKSQCAPVSEEIQQMSNQQLEEKIRRLSHHVKTMGMKLPDKGAKIRANLDAHKKERENRRQSGLLEDGAGSCRPNLPETVVRNSESNKRKQAAPVSPSSQFAASFVQKIEKDKDEDSRICDAFGPELRPASRDDRAKKRQRMRSAGRATPKPSLPPQRKEDAYLVAVKEDTTPRWRSLSDINSCCHLEPRDNCQTLRSNSTNAKEPVILLDEEEAEPMCGQTEVDVALRETTLFYPSRDDPESVQIHYEELQCLSPSKYLSSTIMNFYIRCLQGSSSPKNSDQPDYQFFNTYFYKKVQEAVSHKSAEREALFIKFRRWWKGVNLFQKPYIFIPIHEDHHWSLVIICILHEADESGPVILHLDSLGYHYSRKIFDAIKRFLKEEWNFLKEETGPLDIPIKDEVWQHLPSHIEEKVIEVPQQNNDSDCGVFVLYFMERFIMEAPRRLRKQDLAMLGRKWFKSEEASRLREKIKRILMAKFLNSAGIFEPLTLYPSGSRRSTSASVVQLDP